MADTATLATARWRRRIAPTGNLALVRAAPTPTLRRQLAAVEAEFGLAYPPFPEPDADESIYADAARAAHFGQDADGVVWIDRSAEARGTAKALCEASGVKVPGHAAMITGYGILGWPRKERKTQRYGLAGLYSIDSGDRVAVAVMFDCTAVLAWTGRVVRISATVLETRPSAHVGDLAAGVFPREPGVGEIFELGTGKLFTEWDFDVLNVGVLPDDRSLPFWFDPATLMALHDQTVRLEITDAEG